MEDFFNLKQWVAWRLETTENGKQTKVPYQLNGRKASTTDSSTWANYELIKKHSEKIGFVFTKDDPFVFIDLDHVLDGHRKIKCEWAKELVSQIDSYTEVSPSGDGLHIICKGVVPDGLPNKRKFNDGSALEVYTHGRYATFTGDLYV